MMTKDQAGLRAIDFLHDPRVPAATREMFYGDVLEALIDAIYAAANRMPPAMRDDEIKPKSSRPEGKTNGMEGAVSLGD